MIKKQSALLAMAFFLLSASLAWGQEPLLIYSGAGLMKPMDELKAQYEETYGTPVQMIYAGAGELFGMITVRENGDVYVPGAAKYTQDALEKGLILEEGITTICYHVPVILTPQGNPGGIHCLEDLAKPGIRVALADPQAAAIGKVANALFKKNGLMESVPPNVVARTTTVNQLLIYAATKQVDATIAWEDQTTWAAGKGKVEVVPITPAQNIIKTIPAAVISHTKRPEEAKRFINFITSPKGRKCWAAWGFPLDKPQ